MLPTYEPKNEETLMKEFASRTLTAYISLTTSEVLNTMRREARLARCVLWETARLRKLIIFGGTLKLHDGASILDKELAGLCNVLARGGELIYRAFPGTSEHQDYTIQQEPFQKALRTAKKSLLELEKIFNDQALGELKNGMQGKKSVDHKQLVAKVGNTKEELDKVYGEITTAYRAEINPSSQGQPHVWIGDSG
ncbi:hypothetical protein RB596_002117 [Gaeumannomyces avenae]